jgi:hypothetical protein
VVKKSQFGHLVGDFGSTGGEIYSAAASDSHYYGERLVRVWTVKWPYDWLRRHSRRYSSPVDCSVGRPFEATMQLFFVDWRPTRLLFGSRSHSAEGTSDYCYSIAVVEYVSL